MQLKPFGDRESDHVVAASASPTSIPSPEVRSHFETAVYMVICLLKL
ncbi:hypothetical protein [Anabaena sp. CCY 0017]